MKRDASRRRGVTVVVPTYNSKALLALTLDSLCKQRLAKDMFEVIIVDDGSSDGTHELVSGYMSRINLSYYFQDDLGFRVAAARNLGIANASFEVVLFLDAGILASSELLDLHLNMHQDRHNLSVIGLSYGVLEYDNPESDFIRELDWRYPDEAIDALQRVPELRDCRFDFVESIGHSLARMRAPWLIFWGGHVSISAPALRAAGGFDENFTSWGGEDVELGLRLHQRGCAFEVLKITHTVHYPHPKDAEQKRRDSDNNILYIHRKHKTIETQMLMSMNWESIARAQSFAYPEDGCIRR